MLPDCGVDPTCYLGQAAEGVASDAIQSMADAVLEGLGKGLASLGTVWVNVGTPNLTTTDGGSTPSDAVGFIQDSLWWYLVAVAVLAVIVGGARMALEQRAEPGRKIVGSLMTLSVVSGAGLTGIALAVTAADEFSKWIIDRSTTGTDFGQNIVTMIGLTTTTGSALGPLIVIILGLVALLAAFVQIMLMVVRGGMLVILAGIFPLSASFTNTEMGRSWFRKCIAWLLAFILYKPAAAIVYATAFRLTGSNMVGEDGLTSILTGVVLMILALVALPALMRFVTPMVAATAGGSAGGMMAAGAAAAMPTGAIPTGAGRGSSGGGSPGVPRQSGGSSPSPGPSGAGPTGPKGPGGSGSTPASTGGGNGGGAAPATAGGGSTGALSTGTGVGAAANTGATAAAGPVGIGVTAATAGVNAAQKAGASAVNAATEESTEGGPSGSR